jgi:hypothetical protein
MRRAVLTVPVAALVLATAGCGGGGGNDTTSTSTEATSTTASPPVQTVRIVVQNAAPKGGIVRATIHKGDRVVLVVTSDVADEIHLHGYDKSTNVAAGGTARLPFTANIAGRFEVELESRGEQIADLTVQ